jgi:hypothetical protein
MCLKYRDAIWTDGFIFKTNLRNYTLLWLRSVSEATDYVTSSQLPAIRDVFFSSLCLNRLRRCIRFLSSCFEGSFPRRKRLVVRMFWFQLLFPIRLHYVRLNWVLGKFNGFTFILFCILTCLGFQDGWLRAGRMKFGFLQRRQLASRPDPKYEFILE